MNFSSYRCSSGASLLDRVLDIGSGDNPHPRADVYLDSSLSDSNRWGPLRRDCNLILGELESLPFRDKSFDIALCFHVLEHVNDPIKAAGEIQRVAKRGIIEMPTLYSDLLFQPFEHHRWIFARDGNDVIFSPHPIQLTNINSTESTLALLRCNKLFRAAFLADEAIFRVRHHWQDTIRLRQSSFEEVCQASKLAVQNCREDAFMQTLRRLGGYFSDVGCAKLRQVFRQRQK